MVSVAVGDRLKRTFRPFLSIDPAWTIRLTIKIYYVAVSYGKSLEYENKQSTMEFPKEFSSSGERKRNNAPSFSFEI